ncbi:hypothetical protein RhiJN_06307 [Ceratobasidium sp. AG-Ba]|nr:hypothetical protein RhiJN_06307 [Ceratobasidium sp. AG-Ba]
MAANPQAAQQFAQLCAGFLAAQNNQNPQGEGVSNDPPSDEQDRRPRSLTLGRSSDPAHSVNGNERDRTPQHNTSPLSRRTVQASGPPSREKSESPPQRSKNTPARLKGRSRAQELPRSTPPPLSQQRGTKSNNVSPSPSLLAPLILACCPQKAYSTSQQLTASPGFISNPAPIFSLSQTTAISHSTQLEFEFT